MAQVLLNEKEILCKLALIEKHLKYNSMNFYGPVYTRYDGPEYFVNIQKEASKMLKHVGLANYYPLVSFTNTGQSVGGNVELDDSENVFIEINEKYREWPDLVRAVLAHEICHKLLFVHGLYYTDESKKLENEFLADLATVYVGFGKLSMNGCKFETPDKTQMVSLGYITYSTFAAAYIIVCSRFNVSKSEGLAGLYYSAISEINSTNSFDHKNLSVKYLKETLKIAQSTESEVYKNIKILEGVLSQIKSKIREKHNTLYNELITPFNYNDETLSKQQFIAIEAIKKHGYINKDLCQLNKFLSQAINEIKKEYSDIINYDEVVKTLKDLECPVCGFKKSNALQENKIALYRCPKCNYQFLWDGKLPNKKKAFFSWLLNK